MYIPSQHSSSRRYSWPFTSPRLTSRKLQSKFFCEYQFWTLAAQYEKWKKLFQILLAPHWHGSGSREGILLTLVFQGFLVGSQAGSLTKAFVPFSDSDSLLLFCWLGVLGEVQARGGFGSNRILEIQPFELLLWVQLVCCCKLCNSPKLEWFRPVCVRWEKFKMQDIYFWDLLSLRSDISSFRYNVHRCDLGPPPWHSIRIL